MNSTSNNTRWIGALAMGLTLAVGGGVFAQGEATPAPEPTSASAPERQSMRVVIQDIEGKFAHVRMNEDAEWQPATVGMELGEGAEFRTGPRTRIMITIGDDQRAIIDRLTSMTVLQAFESGNDAKTDLGLRHGRAELQLQSAGKQHQSAIRSPNATLALRGTEVALMDDAAFGPKGYSRTGRASFKAGNKPATPFGGNAPANVDADNPLAAGSALGASVLDPTTGFGRTDAENNLITTLTSFGGGDIGNVVGGASPKQTFDNGGSGGGEYAGRFLVIWIFWDTPGIDLDINIELPNETVMNSKGLRTAQGGYLGPDHTGSPSGGEEFAYFPNGYPEGTFGMGAKYHSGEVANVDFVIQSFNESVYQIGLIVDNVPVTVGNPGDTTTLYVDVPPNNCNYGQGQ